MSIRLLIEKLKDIDMEWRALSEIGEFTYGHVAKAQESGNARFVRITDIDNQGQLIATDPKYVDINEENERFILKKNDLLMARTGATYGKTMIFDEDYPAIYAGFLIKISLDEQRVVPRFYWHFAQSQFFWNQANKLASGGGQPQFNANVLREVEMPIPCPENPKKSLEIQAEIVRILDAFTSLTTELTTELNARKKQYNYYRDKLLSFEEGDVEWKALGEACLIGDGLHGTPVYDETGDYYFINGNNLDKGSIIFSEKTKKVNATMFEKHGIYFDSNKTVFLSINGTVGNVALFNNEKIVLGKSVAFFKIQSLDLHTGYLFYFFQTEFAKNYFESNKTGSTIKNLGLKALRAFKIPVPPLAEQVRIFTILDKFDALTNSITEGLPREIALRQKQYEYYRDLLLSFSKPEQIQATT